MLVNPQNDDGPERDNPETHSVSEPNSQLEGIEAHQYVVPFQPSPEPSETSLEKAIDTAPVSQLRSLLKDLVREHLDAAHRATERLTTPIPGSENRKRKAHEICIHCEAEYHVTDNDNGCCIYHPGQYVLQRAGGLPV